MVHVITPHCHVILSGCSACELVSFGLKLSLN